MADSTWRAFFDASAPAARCPALAGRSIVVRRHLSALACACSNPWQIRPRMRREAFVHGLEQRPARTIWQLAATRLLQNAEAGRKSRRNAASKNAGWARVRPQDTIASLERVTVTAWMDRIDLKILALLQQEGRIS
ncbi:MAG: hypothetical protein EOO22_17610, partial [Comamonadaceae bacterium]